MALNATKRWTFFCAGLLALTVACGDDKSDGEAEAANESGTAEAGTEAEGAEAEAEVGDGDGDQTGDGDGEPGDGDGEPGDGDGEPGDGDGEPGDGDGDGDPFPECADLENPDDCAMNPNCQPVVGSHLKENGPDAPCLEESEFLGCIGMQGCGDAITWFCEGNNVWQVPDTCGPAGAEQCDPPMDPVAACP